VSREETERIMAHSRTGSEENERNRLVGYRILPALDGAAARRDETQTAVLYRQAAPIEKHESVPIGMRQTRRFEAEASEQHGAPMGA
jgi:hypothetical protein